MLNGPSVFSNSSGSSDNVLVQLSAWIPFPLSWFLLFVNVSPYFSCLRLSPCLLILVILFLIRKFLKIERALCMASIWNPQHNLGTHDINKLVQYFFRDAHIPSEEAWLPFGAQAGHQCPRSRGRTQTLGLTYFLHTLLFLTAYSFSGLRIYLVLQLCLPASTKVRECLALGSPEPELCGEAEINTDRDKFCF